MLWTQSSVSRPPSPPCRHKILLRRADAGFSFSGEVREPFPAVIKALEETKVSVTSVDIPSSWDVETGPPKSGLGKGFSPAVLVSLTAPKPVANYFQGRHFVGGRCAPSLLAPSLFHAAMAKSKVVVSSATSLTSDAASWPLPSRPSTTLRCRSTRASTRLLKCRLGRSRSCRDGRRDADEGGQARGATRSPWPPPSLSSDDLAAAVSTVGTDGTWTTTLRHELNFHGGTPRTDQQRRMVAVTEFNIDKIFFPAGWAVSGVLSAH